MTRALGIGWRLGRSTLDLRAAVAFAVAFLGLTSAVAVAVRRSSPLGAVDAVLVVLYDWGLPLTAWAATARASGAARWVDALWPGARVGHSRRLLGLGMWAHSVVIAFACLWPAFAVGVWCATSSRGDALFELARGSTGLGFGVLAYAALFAAASTMRRPARARVAILVLDYVLGSGTSLVALPWPRAHLSSLAGGPAIAALSQRASSGALLVLAVIGLGFLTWETPD